MTFFTVVYARILISHAELQADNYLSGWLTEKALTTLNFKSIKENKMDLTIKNRYPLYMYHKKKAEPVRVDSRGEEVELANKGWSSSYIFKEYPKWVNGEIVNAPTKKESEKTKVVKEDIRGKK